MPIILSKKPGGGGGPGGGVTSLDGLTGAVTLSAGTGITLTPTGNDIEVASTGGYDAYARLWDEKGATTDGGTFTSGADRTRDLNQEYDPDGIVTLAANQFTLQAGTYKITARAPGLQVAQHIAWIHNTSDAAVAILGGVAFAGTTGGQTGSDSWVVGQITIAAQKTFELQHRCATTKATNGFGSQATAIVSASVFSVVEIWRQAA